MGLLLGVPIPASVYVFALVVEPAMYWNSWYPAAIAEPLNIDVPL